MTTTAAPSTAGRRVLRRLSRPTGERRRLTIEIHGTGTHNRGAELMAVAIAQRLHRTFPGVRLVVPPTYTFGKFEARSRYGFFTTWPEKGVRARLMAKIAPAWLTNLAGIVHASEVDVVLDASGFAFSDQWGPQAALTLLNKMNSPERRRQQLILLPQALGPFGQPEVAAAARQLFARAKLVYARDSVSQQLAEPLCGPDKLRLYPDFTVAVTPELPGDVDLPERFCALVPNFRMLDKSGQAEPYLALLRRAVTGLRQRGLNPVFVLHDAQEDRRVIEALASTGETLPVLEHSDPRVLKGILGRADFVIGSRFHALVGALSQGVPCLGAGWSHKYPELFRSFDCAELLLSELGDFAQLDNRLDTLADCEHRQSWRQLIQTAAAALKERTHRMWREVEDTIRAGAGVAGS